MGYYNYRNRDYGYKYDDYEEKGYKHDKHECNFNDVKRYKNYKEVQGKECNMRKDNYYENYYTRYNNYYVKECNHVKDYYRDVNIYHYSQETVYEGCEYLGATTIKDCEKEHGEKFEKEHGEKFEREFGPKFEQGYGEKYGQEFGPKFEEEYGKKHEFDCGCRPMDKDDDKPKFKNMCPCKKDEAWK